MTDVVDYIALAIIGIMGILAVGLAAHEQCTKIDSSKTQFKLIFGAVAVAFIASVVRNLV